MTIGDLTVAEYILDTDPPRAHGPRDITLRRMEQEDGSIKWRVGIGTKFVFTKEKTWTYEPMPSSRTEEFLNTARFDSPQEAIDMYFEWKEEFKNSNQ